MSDKNKDNFDEEDEEEDKSEDEVFVDANDHFVEDINQIKKDLNNKRAKESNTGSLTSDIKSSESSGWLKSSLNTMTSRLSGHKPFKIENKPNVEEMIISIKDETKRELLLEEKLKSVSDEEFHIKQNLEKDKALKLEILTVQNTAETEVNKMGVTVINEDDIQIASDDIEMSPFDSVMFLVELIAVIILDLFVMFGTAHWIYNHLDGLDWYLEDRTYFNFHIFFMTLGICGFGFGILVHRIFRGWSSGALNFLHTTVTLTTLIFFMIGIYSVVLSLEHINCVHFYSVHSWLGLVSMLSIIMVWLSGIIIFVFPRFTYDIQLLLIPVHSFLGRIVFTIVCGTAVIGYSDKLRISDNDIDVGPITTNISLNSNNSDQNETNNWRFIDIRETEKSWQMPEEAFLLNIISLVIFIYALLVDYLSSNEVFRRRLLPEEQGIDIKTRIK